MLLRTHCEYFLFTVSVSSLRRRAFSTKLIVRDPRYLNVHSDTGRAIIALKTSPFESRAKLNARLRKVRLQLSVLHRPPKQRISLTPPLVPLIFIQSPISHVVEIYGATFAAHCRLVLLAPSLLLIIPPCASLLSFFLLAQKIVKFMIDRNQFANASKSLESVFDNSE